MRKLIWERNPRKKTTLIKIEQGSRSLTEVLPKSEDEGLVSLNEDLSSGNPTSQDNMEVSRTVVQNSANERKIKGIITERQ